MGHCDVASETSARKSYKEKSRKKRRAPEDDAQTTQNIALDVGEADDGTQIDDNEPFMANKLAALDVGRKDNTIQEKPEAQPPAADSIHVLLKQALHAADRALLLDCLYNQDDKVIVNSVSLLNGVDIFKLLESLLAIIQSRGAAVIRVLPWLRSLLLQQSSSIISQESSLAALNSLYQLIESRVANLNPAVQLASSLDLLYAGVENEGVGDNEFTPPVIFDDKDESEEEESEEDAMETDEETEEPENISGINDADLGEGVSE